METAEIMQIQQQGDALAVLNRSEIDIQIATAKQYPRDIARCLERIKTIATLDTETAEDCFYALRRGKGNDAKLIEGVSVRLAEIIAGAWGNIRIATRIIGNDGRKITAQAVCHDLETNEAVSLTVDRSIVTKEGKTYTEDMQVVTGNAASAIAFRNAVLKVIPPAVTKKVVKDIKAVAMGQGLDHETQLNRMFGYFGKLGVTKKEVYAYLGVTSNIEISDEMIFELRGLANAIKEGTTTVQETFRQAAESEKMAKEAKAKAESSKKKAEAAMAAAQGKKTTKPEPQPESPAAAPEPQAVDPETGEVIEVSEEN